MGNHTRKVRVVICLYDCVTGQRIRLDFYLLYNMYNLSPHNNHHPFPTADAIITTTFPTADAIITTPFPTADAITAAIARESYLEWLKQNSTKNKEQPTLGTHTFLFQILE